jgi:dienelactone hydrolase
MFSNLGDFADLESALNFNPPAKPLINKDGLIKLFGALPKFPTDFQINRGKVVTHDGVDIEEISWSTGYGPRTEGYLLKPAGVKEKLPGVLFFHSHDDVKSYGKEKLVDGIGDLPENLSWVKRDHYGNRGAANALAKKGFAVLTFDCFMWGSRGIKKEFLAERLFEILGRDDFESASIMHESMSLSKYLSLFGTTLAGLLNFDDRVALEVAKGLPDMNDSISVVGLSGGGCRAIYMHATSPEVNAVVSVGAMATYKSMVPIHIAPHSWMFFPAGLAQVSDWPGLTMINKTPLYVQFCGEDQLFTKAGMADADKAITSHFKESGGIYKSATYPVKHSFTVDMQENAFDWLVANA